MGTAAPQHPLADRQMLLGERVGYDPRRVLLYRAARGMLWLAAFVTLIPLLIVVAMAVASPGETAGGSLVIALISGACAALLVTGGHLCAKGERSGQWVAAPALVLLALVIPVGTLLALRVSRTVSYAFED